MIEEPVKYITKVEIQGLFGRYDIEWNLHTDVNVLAGINGSGKSTILSAINNVVRQKVEFTYGGGRTIRNMQHNINNIDLFFDYISTTGGIHNIVDTVNFIHTFDSEAKPQETLQKVDNQVKTELDLELWLVQTEYMKYQIRLYKYSSDINRNTHTRFLAMINELFSETHKKVNPDKEGLEFLLGDKEINAYQLSSGEKQLLVILLTVLVQDNKPSILLMDEPEISLHIEWQRKLIKYIHILNPNAQIIIATHSPDIIIKGWLDKVVNIEDIIVKDNAVA